MPSDMYLEHPDITSALRTGYPRSAWVRETADPHWCEVCCCLIDEDEIYEDRYHNYLCEDCLKLLHKKE